MVAGFGAHDKSSVPGNMMKNNGDSAGVESSFDGLGIGDV